MTVLLQDYVHIRNKQTGQSKGFGFVTYSDPSSVDKCLAAKPHTINQKDVSLRHCPIYCFIELLVDFSELQLECVWHCKLAKILSFSNIHVFFSLFGIEYST